MEQFGAASSDTPLPTCGLYGVACKYGFLLVEIMKGQVETGGFPKLSDTYRVGPVASRDSWDEYTERTEVGPNVAVQYPKW
jgi:hypothetical protein